MTYTTDSPLIGTSTGSPEAVLAWLADAGIDPERPGELGAYLEELYRLCELAHLDAGVLVAQAVHETDAFRSFYWSERLNPAGMGITGDPIQNAASQRWATGTDAARAHVVHLWAYSTLRLPTGNPLVEFIPLDRRYRDVFDAGFDSTVHVVGDLGSGKWAKDPRYAEQIVAKANAIFGGTTTMPPNQYQVVGLPNPITLSFPLAHDIIGPIQVRQRPGIVRITPGYWIQHETDNHASGADAEMHARYLDSGADGRQASWHFTVDDGMAYQHIPVNEVTWQAADGNGPGNMSGVSCELCVNADSDQVKARHNAEELCAQVCKALGLGSDRVKRHWDFNEKSADRHHCPDTMMSDGYWPTFVANVATLLTPPPPPPPVYASPQVPDWFPDSVRLDAPSDADVNGTRWYVVRRNFQALKNAQRYSEPRTTAPKSGPKINVRDKVRAERQFTAKDDKGRNRTWLVLPDGSFVTAASFNPNVRITGR